MDNFSKSVSFSANNVSHQFHQYTSYSGLRKEDSKCTVHCGRAPRTQTVQAQHVTEQCLLYADKVEGTVFTPWFQDVRRSKQVHLLSRFNFTHQQEHPNRHLCHLQKFPQIIASKNKDFIILYQNFPKKQSGTDS